MKFSEWVRNLLAKGTGIGPTVVWQGPEELGWILKGLDSIDAGDPDAYWKRGTDAARSLAEAALQHNKVLRSGRFDKEDRKTCLYVAVDLVPVVSDALKLGKESP